MHAPLPLYTNAFYCLEPNDGLEPGRVLRADVVAGRGGNGGRHHGHQVRQRRRRDTHPELAAHT